MRKIAVSLNDSTNGPPSVLGNHNASGTEVKLAEPKLSTGSLSKIISGRYTQPWRKMDDIFSNMDCALFCNYVEVHSLSNIPSF